MRSTFNKTAPAAAAKTTAKRAEAKPAAKATVVEDTTFVQAEPISGKPEVEESRYAKMMASVDAYFAEAGLPSWKRRMVSFLLGLVSYAGVFYMAMQLLDIVAMAVLIYCGPGFLTFLTVFLGFVLALMAAGTVGMAVYNTAMRFEYTSVKDRVTGWFSRADKELAHA